MLELIGAAIVVGGMCLAKAFGSETVTHAHVCGCCGRRWEHRGPFANEDASRMAHSCPACGTEQWQQESVAGAPPKS